MRNHCIFRERTGDRVVYQQYRQCKSCMVLSYLITEMTGYLWDRNITTWIVDNMIRWGWWWDDVFVQGWSVWQKLISRHMASSNRGMTSLSMIVGQSDFRWGCYNAHGFRLSSTSCVGPRTVDVLLVVHWDIVFTDRMSASVVRLRTVLLRLILHLLTVDQIVRQSLTYQIRPVYNNFINMSTY